jgi:hypothetical protein
MKIENSKLRVRAKRANKILIATLINQAKYELIGGVFSDKQGKIHYVELVSLPSGERVIDYPNGIEILDAKQVGVSW